MTGVHVHDASIVPVSVVQELFGELYGKTLNKRKVSASIEALQRWYNDNFYYAKVVDICQGAWWRFM